MAVKYKVWLHIEKIDEDKNLYEDMEDTDIPQSVEEFNTYDDAVRLVYFLSEVVKFVRRTINN